MSLFKQSATGNVAFLMISNVDNTSPVTGLTPTVTISKNNAAFASPGGTVSEIGNGWYSLAMTTTDTGTLGELLLHATGAGSNAADDRHQVVLDLPGATVSSVTGAVGSVTGAVGSVTGNVGGNVVGTVASVVGAVGSVTGNVGGSVASVVGAVGSVTGAVGSVTGAVGSVTGNVGGNLVGNVNGNVVGSVGSVTGAVGSVTGAVGSVTGNVGGNVTGSVGSVIGLTAANLDVAVSTRLATSGYTAPDNSDIAAIKAKTDNLPTDPASNTVVVNEANLIIGALNTVNTNVSTRLPTSSYVAPDNAGIASIESSITALPGAVWDVTLAGHETSGSTGAALAAAASGGGGGGSSTGGCPVVGFVVNPVVIVGLVKC